jgi:threonine dehydrogenase-like Zn-dependent dehydrogenase
VLAGIPDATATLAVRDIVGKRLEIHSVFGAPRRAWAAAVTAFEEGVLDPAVLVTHELDLGEAAHALTLLSCGDADVG